MNKQVEEYLNEMQRYEKFEELKQKNQTLINAGLYEKVPLSSDEEVPEYMVVYDKLGHRFRAVPIDVTDEEFEAIRKYSSVSKGNKRNKRNRIGIALKIVAILFFVMSVIFFMLILATDSYFGEDIKILYFAYCIASIIIGILFLGFGEIIRLLQNLTNKS